MTSGLQTVSTPPWRERLPSLLGLMGLAGVTYAGALQLSWVIVPLAGLIFAGASLYEKRHLWRLSLERDSRAAVAKGIALTILVQQIVVGVFYILFFGIAAAITGRSAFAPFGGHAILVLAFIAACFAAGAWLKNRAAPASDPDDTGEILDGIEELAASTIVMPVRIFQLASRVAQMNIGSSAAMIEYCAAREDSVHVRRVAFTALRFMKLPDNPVLDTRAFLDRGLSDPHPWVRYDAVWVAETLGYDDEALRAKLAEIADGLEPPASDEHPPSSDALLQSRIRAARLLKKLRDGGAA